MPQLSFWKLSYFALGLLYILPSVAHADRIDDYVRSQMLAQGIPGLSIAVVKNGQIVKAEGYGYANIEQKTPASPQTMYKLASLTKQFTAAGIMLLVQDGKVKLDDKISQYVDGIPSRWHDITLRELLNQTSGIKDDLNELHIGSTDGTTARELLGVVGEYPLNFPPGTDWSYSNTNYLLLGQVIQKVTGLPIGDFLNQRIFQPLGMSATRLESTSDLIPNRSGNYTWAGKKLENSVVYNPSIWDHGESGIMSNVRDLARWDAGLISDKLLTPASKDLMWSPGPLRNGAEYYYGFGWSLSNRDGNLCVFHGGTGPGISNGIVRYLDRHLTVIALVNVDKVDAVALAGKIAALYDPGVEPPLEGFAMKTDTKSTPAALVLAILTQLRQGTLDLTPFDQKERQEMSPDFYTAASKFFRTFGNLQSVAMVRSENDPAGAAYRFETVFARATLKFDLSLDEEGKISQMGWSY
jgi:CubicO group peptidase (beta-lactamase class C family)